MSQNKSPLALRRLKISSIGLLAASGFAFTASTASAATLYHQDFNSFTSNVTVVGQGTPAFESYYFGSIGGDASATIQPLGVGGSKGLEVDSGSIDSSMYLYQPALNLNAAGQKIRVSFALDINPSIFPGDPTTLSEFVGGIFNPDGALIAAIGIGTSGNIVYTGTAGQTSYTLATPITVADGFHTLAMDIDFTTATPTGIASLDGTVLPITLGVKATAGSTIGDFDFLANPYGYNSAVIDNMDISTIVPEPMSMGAMLLGGLLLRRRR